LTRTRLAALLLAISCVAVMGQARRAQAAAEVHRLNLLLSAIPTHINAADYNDRLDHFNRRFLEPGGVKGIEEIRFAWLFDSELRYFVKQNIAVTAGVGQLRRQSAREFLPAITADIQLRAEVLSVPIHVGGAYYLQPYNQGDFQARAFFGAGFMSLVYNRARLQIVSTFVDTTGTSVQSTSKSAGQGDAPGYYVEGGVHMFFASRFSVVLGGIYRSAMVRDPRGVLQFNQQKFFIPRMADLNPDVPLGGLQEFDTTGLGARMGLAIGF
jgi:hypothetical protein